MSFWSDTRGNIAVIFALVLVPVVLLAGGMVDYTRTQNVEARLQAALDAAVLAGLGADDVAVARSVFSANLSGTEGALSGPDFTLGSDTLTGTAAIAVPTGFLGIARMETLTARATATAKKSSSTVCVLLVEPTGSQPLLVNGGAVLNAPDCEVHVRSTGSPAAIFNAGTTFTTKKTCLAGSTPIYNSTTVANVETRCSAATDPFAGALPVPESTSCTASNGNFNGGSVSLSPGVYCGWFNFNGAPTVTLAPGLYVIKNGGWNVNGGRWTGTGVTFYFADTSKIQFNSGISATLKAPTSGTYSGILMYEPPGLSRSQFVFNDSVANELEGLIYLPSRDVTFNAKSNLATDKATLVFRTLILDQTRWNLAPAASRTIGGAGGGGSVRLVR
ncbi:Von Willebrand factor type A domain protein [Rhodovulum sp. PH10]|uniref:TadE/TadG family type IV pilus assembly protein n=1 Tax=Rhodovulum sp. PH10 TaxID=1187851 RepID=UPI00027C2723|nr:pilus assembly protein TadG-related protein [Rhodovulum sp. PH10]EJW13436.1 Von Willebrand factor type A domain protein [Rhodovulum sp. PH10]